jgi:hypothetical protein
MRLRYIAIVVAAFLPVVSNAQSDRIVLSAEPNRVVCELAVPSAGFHQIHMIHQGSTPRVGVNFRAVTPACWPDGVWLGDVVPSPLIKLQSTHGNGIAISYPACDMPPGYLGYMNFYAPTPVPSCCEYPITPHLESTGGTMVVTCGLTALVASTGPLVINPNAGCSCSQPVPVTSTTWGAVKALYQ